MDSIQKAGSGHPGMPMGFADVATVLFQSYVRHAPWDPDWPNRDRFVLSAGHGSMLVYSLLHVLGYAHMSVDALKQFRQLNSVTPGHPEHGLGIETTTGPLGQGFANAVGMAMAEKMMHATYDFMDHRTYAVVGDGCLMEGISYEAAALAGHWQLNKLTVLFDDNAITIDGPTSLANSEDMTQRFQACQWATRTIDGHDMAAIDDALQWAQTQNRPCFIACQTTIGYGAPTKQGTAACHGAALGTDEVAKARRALNWSDDTPFHVPEPIMNAWRQAGAQHKDRYDQWHARVASHPLKERFWTEYNGQWAVPDLSDLVTHYQNEQPCQATRTTSGAVIRAIRQKIPLVHGSADLSESNQMAPSDPPFSANNPSGRYVHYGVREHAMASIMNGIALHKGLIPCAGTFLCFADYARPAIRLSAMMGLHVIYIMTHDSIGLGEDGPTHQPIEHLASLRAIPNLYVFRPCDAIETVQCWQLALSMKQAPSVLCLTRQNVPCVTRISHATDNPCANGAYIVQNTQNPPSIDLWATGSEVALACAVRAILEDKGYATRVISMPCWRLFDQSTDDAAHHLLRADTLKVAIEAASPMGWHTYVGHDGLVFGIDSFGHSAPANALFDHYGFNADTMAHRIMDHLTHRCPRFTP
jgi:transketolase